MKTYINLCTHFAVGCVVAGISNFTCNPATMALVFLIALIATFISFMLRRMIDKC